jgi:TonB family protein
MGRQIIEGGCLKGTFVRAKSILVILPVLFFALAAVPNDLGAKNFKEHFEIGKDLFAKGDFEQAASEFQEAFRRKPNSVIAKSWLGLAYARWGNSLRKTGDTDRAIEIYKKAVDKLPDEPYWHAYLATALAKKGDRGAAAQEFGLAATLAPLDDGLMKEAQDPSGEWPDAKRISGVPGPAMENVGKAKHNLTGPIPTFKPEPKYSKRARDAQLQGTLVLGLVIDATGNVSGTKIVEPLGLGLVSEALKTVRTWKFKPAMKDGVAVPVKVAVEVAFKLF